MLEVRRRTIVSQVRCLLLRHTLIFILAILNAWLHFSIFANVSATLKSGSADYGEKHHLQQRHVAKMFPGSINIIKSNSIIKTKSVWLVINFFMHILVLWLRLFYFFDQSSGNKCRPADSLQSVRKLWFTLYIQGLLQYWTHCLLYKTHWTVDT